MLSLTGSAYKNCDGFTRRNFLQVGAPLLGLGLSDILRSESEAKNGDTLIVDYHREDEVLDYITRETLEIDLEDAEREYIEVGGLKPYAIF